MLPILNEYKSDFHRFFKNLWKFLLKKKPLKAEKNPRTNLTRKATDSSNATVTFQIKKEAIQAHIEKIWGWDEEEQYQFHLLEISDLQEYLLYDENELIGYLQLQEEDTRLFVFGIYLLKNYQSKGYGSFLFQELIQEAQIKQKTLALEVFKINKNALRFYKRLGFQIVSETESHYLLWK